MNFRIATNYLSLFTLLLFFLPYLAMQSLFTQVEQYLNKCFEVLLFEMGPSILFQQLFVYSARKKYVNLLSRPTFLCNAR